MSELETLEERAKEYTDALAAVRLGDKAWEDKDTPIDHEDIKSGTEARCFLSARYVRSAELILEQAKRIEELQEECGKWQDIAIDWKFKYDKTQPQDIMILQALKP